MKEILINLFQNITFKHLQKNYKLLLIGQAIRTFVNLEIFLLIILDVRKQILKIFFLGWSL